MLGYTEETIKDVVEDLWNVKAEVSKDFLASVEIAIDFLEGLLAEVRI